jgi:hypothetical protein
MENTRLWMPAIGGGFGVTKAGAMPLRVRRRCDGGDLCAGLVGCDEFANLRNGPTGQYAAVEHGTLCAAKPPLASDRAGMGRRQ